MLRRIAGALLAFGTCAGAADAATYRAVVLAVGPARIVLAGGGVLVRAADCACATVRSGTAAAIELAPDGSVTRLAPLGRDAGAAASADAIPAGAFAFARVAPAAGDASRPVEIRIAVTVPARTPAADDVYLSTEKSGWNPSDLRMNRIDARHWAIVVTLPRGARFAYRYTRGSFAASERDTASQLPPAHTLVAEPGGTASDEIARWADID